MRILTDERLPFASSAGIAGELRVGLETHFSCERRLNFTLIPTSSWEECATKLGLHEELSVKNFRRRVERCSGNSRINLVGSSDSVTEK